jgi:hypothetical protein
MTSYFDITPLTTLSSILWLPFLGAAQLSDPWKTTPWKPGMGGEGNRPAWGESRQVGVSGRLDMRVRKAMHACEGLGGQL